MITRERIIVAGFAICLGASGVALAQANVADGSIQKIDQSAGKLTIKHGPIKNLDMDSMTMVFRVQDPEMLKKVKVGQKVKFEADRVNGQITVTRIEPTK
jgi:Cu(I)/Ag(I) efflux system protein CusF